MTEQVLISILTFLLTLLQVLLISVIIGLKNDLKMYKEETQEDIKEIRQLIYKIMGSEHLKI